MDPLASVFRIVETGLAKARAAGVQRPVLVLLADRTSAPGRAFFEAATGRPVADGGTMPGVVRTAPEVAGLLGRFFGYAGAVAAIELQSRDPDDGASWVVSFAEDGIHLNGLRDGAALAKLLFPYGLDRDTPPTRTWVMRQWRGEADEDADDEDADDAA